MPSARGKSCAAVRLKVLPLCFSWSCQGGCRSSSLRSDRPRPREERPAGARRKDDGRGSGACPTRYGAVSHAPARPRKRPRDAVARPAARRSSPRSSHTAPSPWSTPVRPRAPDGPPDGPRSAALRGRQPVPPGPTPSEAWRNCAGQESCVDVNAVVRRWVAAGARVRMAAPPSPCGCWKGPGPVARGRRAVSGSAPTPPADPPRPCPPRSTRPGGTGRPRCADVVRATARPRRSPCRSAPRCGTTGVRGRPDGAGHPSSPRSTLTGRTVLSSWIAPAFLSWCGTGVRDRRPGRGPGGRTGPGGAARR